MRSKLVLLALCSTVAACNTPDLPSKGVASVNVPVVTTTSYVMDTAAPGGFLAPGEAQKLDGWFQGLGLGYGDAVYVDAAAGDPARQQVAVVAGRFGMLVSQGAPVTAGTPGAETVRVIVNRSRAVVPNCPNWSRPAQPNYDNSSMSNFGCGVNTNIAMQVANPEDLIHGQEGTGVSDVKSATKAIQLYRSQTPSGSGGLQDIKGSK